MLFRTHKHNLNLCCCPATSSLTCVDLQSLGSAIGQLTVSQIEALEEAEVYSCVETLGGHGNWTDEQTAALLTRLTDVSWRFMTSIMQTTVLLVAFQIVWLASPCIVSIKFLHVSHRCLGHSHAKTAIGKSVYCS